MDKLYFGPAGVPLCVKSRNTVEGVRELKKLRLDSMELEFVHGVRMTTSMAKQVNTAREEEGIELSAHGPYYINLNSLDRKIQMASATRILETARISKLCGASTITFHAAYYMKMEKEKVYTIVKEQLKRIVETLKHEKNKIWIRPELTGKETQFGNLQELIQLSQEIDQVLPCIDFSHIHARYNGKYNTYKEFMAILEELEKGLGRDIINNMHMHISGINYGPKGERNHLLLKDADLNYKELMKALKDFNVKGLVVCESPNVEKDTIILKRTYEEFKP